jgi:hypothetical protein
MRLTSRSNNGLLYVTEISEELRNQGSLLLRLVIGQPAPADGDSLKVRLDWNIVKLTRTGGEVVVQEPDYTRNSESYLPSLNFTCSVLHAQQLVHERLNVSSEPVNYDEGVLVYPGGLSMTGMATIRQLAKTPEDSGWRVFDAERIDWMAEPLGRRVYEIAGERPALLSTMSLPVGWSIRMEGGLLTEAVSPEGQRHTVNMTINL